MHLLCQSGKSYTDETHQLTSTTGALSDAKSKPGIASSFAEIYVAKYRISRVYGEIRRNWFFSNFDRIFLETVKRPLALVLSIDRGRGVLAKGVEKSEIRKPVFKVQWVKVCKNANFQTKNANFQTPISLPIGGRPSPFKNHMC